MLQPKIYLLAGFIIITLIIGISLLDLEDLSSAIELVIVPALTILYLRFTKNKPKFFSLFLILYSVGDFIFFLDYSFTSKFLFYICNPIYIMAYICLFVFIFKTINVKKLFKSHSVDLVVMFLLAIYMVYVLIGIVKPEDFETRFDASIQIIELIYNVLLILLVSISFLNYIQNTKPKFFILFIGCFSLALSEFLLIGYYYISEDIRLSYLSSIFYFTGFLLLIYQSREMYIESKTK